MRQREKGKAFNKENEIFFREFLVGLWEQRYFQNDKVSGIKEMRKIEGKYRLCQPEHEEDGPIHRSVLGLRGKVKNYQSKTGEGRCHLPVQSPSRVVVCLEQASPSGKTAACHYFDCCLSLLILLTLSHTGAGWGYHIKHPCTWSYPHGEGPDSAYVLPWNLLSQLTTSTTSLRLNQTEPPSAFTPMAFSLWILNHLMGYIINYSFLSLYSMISILVFPVIQICLPCCNQFSETVLMWHALHGWLYWKIY